MPEAREFLDKVAKRMDADQIDQAKQMAEHFRQMFAINLKAQANQ